MEILSFDAVQVAAVLALVTTVVQGIKKGLEWLASWEGAPDVVRRLVDWWAHGAGPAILTAAVSLCVTVLPPIIEDGSLTTVELSQILQALGIGVGATLVYWVVRLKGPLAWLAKRLGK